MIGSLIGGALQVGGSIFGHASAAKAMKKVKQNIETQRAKNEDWYNRRYNEDATQRADAQRILTLTAERMQAQNRNAAGTAAVMGGSEETVAATKAANAQGMAEAASNIAANGEARKDQIEQQYIAQDNAYQDKLNELEMAKAQGVAQAAQSLSQVGGAISSAF